MSGGSWNYFYEDLQKVAKRLRSDENNRHRRLLGAQLERCAKALHDIEWVDSCDYGPGDEMDSIHEALAPLPDLASYKVVTE